MGRKWDKGWGPSYTKFSDPWPLFFILLIAVPIAVFSIIVVGGLALTTLYVMFAALLGGH